MSPGYAECVPGGEAAILQRVPWPGQGQGKPHFKYLGYAGRRENGQESGRLLLLALGGVGKTELCFGERVIGTEEGEEEMISGGGQMLQGLMSHEMVCLCV